jgi:hypothetical protein
MYDDGEISLQNRLYSNEIVLGIKAEKLYKQIKK